MVVRWILVLLAFVWLLPTGQPKPEVFYLWWTLAVSNYLFLTYVFIVRRFTVSMYYLSTIVDTLLVTGAIFMAGDIGHYLTPLYLLTMNEAALKFGWRGGLLSGGFSTVLGGLAVVSTVAPQGSARWMWLFVLVVAAAATTLSSIIAEKELAAYELRRAEPLPKREIIEHDVLLQVVGQTSAGLAPSNSFRPLLGVIRDFFRADVCLLYEINDDAGRLEVAASVDGDVELFRLWQGLYSGKMADCIVQSANGGLVVADCQKDCACFGVSSRNAGRPGRLGAARKPDLPCVQLVRAREAHSLMCVPVVEDGDGSPIGVLHCLGLRPQAFSEEDLGLFTRVAAQLAPAWRNAKEAPVERTSYIDAATGVYNLAYFEQRVDEEVVRAKRFGHPLSLVVVGITDAAGSNERQSTPGYSGESERIALLANCVKNHVRQVDAVCRLGTEKIAVILPDTERDNASRVADRVRRELEKSGVFDLGGASEAQPASISIGVTELMPDDLDGAHLLAHTLEASQPVRIVSRNRAS